VRPLLALLGTMPADLDAVIAHDGREALQGPSHITARRAGLSSRSRPVLTAP